MQSPILHSRQVPFSTSRRHKLAAIQTISMCCIFQVLLVHATEQMTVASGVCYDRSTQTLRSCRHTQGCALSRHWVPGKLSQVFLHSYSLVMYLQRSAAAHHQATCQQCFPPPAVKSHTHLSTSAQHWKGRTGSIRSQFLHRRLMQHKMQ